MDSRRSIVLARICVTHDLRPIPRLLHECESIERIDASFVIVFVARDDCEVRGVRSDPSYSAAVRCIGSRQPSEPHSQMNASVSGESGAPTFLTMASLPARKVTSFRARRSSWVSIGRCLYPAYRSPTK
jgi:hypothetical protein